MSTRLFYAILLGIYLCPILAKSQAIIRSAESKSGILAGTTNVSDFVGITYENGTDEFIFNYKLSKQLVDTTDLTYPNSWGMNFDFGFALDESKSSLIKDEEWQGRIKTGLTLLKMWDLTGFGTPTTSKTTTGYSAPGGETVYKSLQECRTAEGVECSETSTTITGKKPDFVKQITAFANIENNVGRIHTWNESMLNADTTLAIVRNPYQNKFTLSAGVSGLLQVHDRVFLAAAFSLNTNFINRSTAGLTSGNFMPVSGIYYNSTDTTMILNQGEAEEFFKGNPRRETQFIPRIDFFARWRMGDEKPYLGIIAAAAPVMSSVNGVKTRKNFLIGPSLSLAGLPDQVVFAIMSEWQEDKDGEMKYALTFHASFPIKIK